MCQEAYISPDQRAALAECPFFSAKPDDLVLDETPADAVAYDPGDVRQDEQFEEEEPQEELQDHGAARVGPLVGGSLPSPIRDTPPDEDAQGFDG